MGDGLDKISCPGCGHDYEHLPNIFGKVCIRCGYVMDSDYEFPVQKQNRIRFEEMRRKAIEQITRKLKS